MAAFNLLLLLSRNVCSSLRLHCEAELPGGRACDCPEYQSSFADRLEG